MRRIIALLLALAALALPPVATAQERSYRYERIDVTVDVRPDGVLSVAETYTYRFSGGPFRKALRGIAHDRLDRIANVSLSESGRAYRQAFSPDEPETFMVSELPGETLVDWFYPPTSDAARSFSLRYEVYGAVRVDPEADQIWWVAVFAERDVPVEQASVTMRFPAGANLKPTSVTLPAADGALDVQPRTITLTRDTPLVPGEALELRADFAPDLIDAPAPDWQTAPPAPATPEPEPERASDSSEAVDWIWIVLGALIVGSSIVWRALGAEPLFGDSGDSDDDDWSSSSAHRRSSSSSSSRSSSSSSRSSSSSSSRSSSSSSRGGRGGSGGGRGGAG